MTNKPLPFGLDSVAEHVSKLTVRGGLATKICHVVIYVSLAIAAICWSVQTIWVAVTSLVFVFILSFVSIWRLIDLADKNPHSALMEGAELLIHEQLKLGEKGHPDIYVSQTDVIPKAPVTLTESEIRVLNQPEDKPIEALFSGKPE